MTKKPKLFVGSSKEGLPFARAIQALLDERLEITIWDQGVFEPSSHTIEALVAEAKRSAFAILVLSPDDEAVIRGVEQSTARDNVLFELGLFIGILGRKRVFVITPSDKPDFRIPSDLLGITTATYRQRSDNNYRAALGPACDSIIQAAQRVYSEDPEPGCAYEHTHESSLIIPLAPDRFSIVFQPPMRCSPSMRFNTKEGVPLIPRSFQNWSRYGLTVMFETAISDDQLCFYASAKPPQL